MEYVGFLLQQQPSSNPVMSFLPLIFIVAIFYFLVFMPMQKQKKQQAQMLASLQTYGVLTAHWWMFVSGLALLPTFLLFYSFADSLQRRFQVLDLSR